MLTESTQALTGCGSKGMGETIAVDDLLSDSPVPFLVQSSGISSAEHCRLEFKLQD